MFKLHPQLAKDTVKIIDLDLCSALLMNDSQFPWVILVPRRDNITEIHQMNETDRQQLQRESHLLSCRLMSHFQGDKLNIGALGNLVPQLHIHHIVRYTGDVAWPNPVWGKVAAIPYSDAKRSGLVTELRELIAG